MTSPEPAEAVRAGNRARGPGVIGLATTCALDRNGNYGSAELSIVPDARDPDGLWGRRGTADRVSLMIEAINWAETRIERSIDTFRLEFYVLDAPFAVAYRNKRNEDKRLVWNPDTRKPYEEPPVIVPLAELPPAHLLKG